jgi:hypothetical protein
MDNKIILEAIVRQKCFNATYNRTLFKLAPYILYTRHGESYLDAIPVERNGMMPRETKLGTFKVSGLSGLSPNDEQFERDPIYVPQAEKYAGVTLLAIADKQ